MAEGSAESSTAAGRRELLARMLAEQGILPPGERSERRRGAAGLLSFAQERLWFLDQLDPGSSAYNIARALRLSGRLDAKALVGAVNEVVRRHEVLRANFPCVDGRPVAQVAVKLDLQVPLIDVSGLAPSLRRAELRRVLNEKAAASFDLARDALIRVDLIRLSKAEHVLLLVLHQMVCDGWSMSLFLRESAALYRSFIGAQAEKPPRLKLQYRDYAARQRAQLTTAAWRDQLAYWKSRLRGSSSAIALATDHPRPSARSWRGARLPLELPGALGRRLGRLAATAGATPFMVLMAAFNTLLWRYAAQDDISVGFPVANRDDAGTASLIGFFVNTLVLRTDLSGNPTFLELLQRVREQCRGALARRDLPFDKLVEELQRDRDWNRNSLFQVMFAYQNYPAAAFDVPGLRTKTVNLDVTTAKFDLMLSLTERGSSLRGFIEYAADLFDRSTIARMARHYRMLLRGIVADPNQPIAVLPLLTQAERRRILVQWNNTGANVPKNRLIHQLFEAQARRIPRAVAVECDGKQLTYGELDRRANRLARFLQKRGVGAEKIVGVCLERSLNLVVAVLAILKSGGAYLPLDPKYPRERIAFMLEDARASVLVTQAKFAGCKGSSSFHRPLRGRRMKTVRLDADGKKIALERSSGLLSGAQARNLAYVIYTSGSTGQPKGVAIEHRNAVAFLQWAKSVFSRAELAAVGASTSVCFDLSIFEIFAPLSRGGKTILAQDALDLADRIERSDITLVNTVPSAMKELLAAGGLPRSVRTVNLAGEPLKPELVRQLYATGTVDRVYDLYGPSETTTYSTFTLRRAHGRATIGRPVANTQIYLLDAALHPVPVGAPGEIFIGGAGVARGYLHRPELTAEKFLADPFANRSGARMYRTGDIGRYYPDGNIEYLGRADHQVKIRGYRIELGEIETALAAHPAVRECVAAARKSAEPSDTQKFNPQNLKSDVQLLAYFVPRAGILPSTIELRDFLREKLPEFMLPSMFLPVAALPLTPNGKVDRRGLPQVDGNAGRVTHDFAAPRNELEEVVAQVWREVLDIERFGVFEDFFDLGGHSLLAARVAARLRRTFGVELPLRRLFEAPTVAGLAREIDALRSGRRGVALPGIVPARRTGPVPLSFAQRRLWFLHKLEPDLAAYNMPAAHRIHGPLHVALFERALHQIIHRHEVLRSAVVEIGGEPMQQIQPNTALNVPVIDLSALPAEQAAREVARYSNEDAEQSFDLATAPLMRAKVLRLGDREHVLLLNFHHIVCDGWSLAVFYRELAGLYGALLEGRDSALAPLPAQYADFAMWQQHSLQAGQLEPQMAYWRRQLGAGLALIDLPADGERPLAQTYRGGKVSRRLSRDLTAALKALARKEHATLFMMLLAALDIVLSRLAGREEMVVGSTIAGRSRPELEGLIGFFINALPLRVDLSGNPRFVELLQRVREVCLDAYTHQDLPFERVVEELKPSRDVSRNPIFQILFNMADVSERELKLSGCATVKLQRAAPGAKFDLVFHAPEIDGAIALMLVYNADLFTEARATAMLQQWAYLLSQIAAAPGKRIDQFSLAAPARQRVLPDPTEQLDDAWVGAVHELIARRAASQPGKTAVADDVESWSYRELDRASNRLAHRLRRDGIGPKDVVALYAHRDASLALAILGALKAGAVFVILDPAYPRARSKQYLRIARPKALLQMAGAGELPAELARYARRTELGAPMILPRTKRELARLLARCADDGPAVSVGPDDPAYIAFTSGSTGLPKGVLCRHGPITHFLPWQSSTFDLRDVDRYALLSGLGYNHLHRDLFTALALGATLRVPAEQDLQEPERLARWLDSEEISVLHLTPARGRLLQTAAGKLLPSLRRIFFGGDLLLRQDVLAMRELAPNAELVSFYGATETQRAVGHFVIGDALLKSDDRARRAVPIGRGAPDVQLLLLTPGGLLAGIGEVGELYIRSPHLAAGYAGDRELSRTNFVLNPFTGDARDRLYRTRELGRYLPDGNVEWLGRNDRRASIRGFRVELAEVETALRRCPGVRHAAAVAERVVDEASGGDARLVAYVECAEDRGVGTAALRDFLTVRLPRYMIPTDFHFVERMPFNPNGKIDYAGLSRVESLQLRVEGSFEAPRNNIERVVAKIFAEVLRLERIGRRDNFFEHGGHSLLAAKAAAHLRETLGVELDLRTFLELPTVEAICRRIEAAQTDGGARLQSGEREEIEL